MLSLLGLDPETYRAHPLHAPDRTYPETNCYTDILVELVHALGLEPLAALGAAVRADFEGDQWTFLKPDPADLESLYGIDIHEMQPYRPLPEQIAEQLEAGRTLIVELDSFYLPDTKATAYRVEHVKSSAVMEAIDPDGERLRYFHNGGYYELAGDDYRLVLRLEPQHEGALPPYVELARFDAGTPLRGDELRAAAKDSFEHHLGRLPQTNPFDRYGESLARELPGLLDGSHEDYHAYAFATVRMAGSSFEVAASYLDWLFGDRAAAAREAYARIVNGSKTLSLRLARRRAFDPEPILAELAAAWAEATVELTALA